MKSASPARSPTASSSSTRAASSRRARRPRCSTIQRRNARSASCAWSSARRPWSMPEIGGVLELGARHSSGAPWSSGPRASRPLMIHQRVARSNLRAERLAVQKSMKRRATGVARPQLRGASIQSERALECRRCVDPDHPAAAPSAGAMGMRQVGAEEEAAALGDRVRLAADHQLELALEDAADLLAVMLERTAHLAVGGKADDEAFKQPDIGKRHKALGGAAVALDDAAAGLAGPLGRAVDHAGLFLGLRQQSRDADIERPAQPMQRGERRRRAIVLDARQQAGRARRALGEVMQGELLDATKVAQPAAEAGTSSV